jgi:hypothetical protein
LLEPQKQRLALAKRGFWWVSDPPRGASRAALFGRIISLSLLFVALLYGCGVKGAPIPPQMAKPAPITDLQASANPSGINLSWSRPTHYAGGHTMRDLNEFVILRAEDHKAFEPLVELPLSDQERFSQQRAFSYVDGETQIGNNYRYEIVSRTVDGYTSAPSNEVAFTLARPGKVPKPENFTLPTPTPLPTNLP